MSEGLVVDVSQSRRVLGRIVSSKSSILAAGIIAFAILVAVFAPLVAPYDPLAQDLSRTLEGPSVDYWLGTDNLGRDVLSRLIFGARISLVAALIAVVSALLIGIPIGFLSGYVGGRLDALLMRTTDAFMSLPNLLLVIAIIAVLGSSLTNAMLALGIVFAPTIIRLTRGQVLAEREELYVDAARTLGLGAMTISYRHLLPHIVAPLIIQTSLMLGWAMILEAGLSFIGLGVQPPDASWGAMLANASSFISHQPFLVWPPGLAITFVVLALNLFGDGLRDSLGRGLPAGGGPTGGRVSRGERADRAILMDGQVGVLRTNSTAKSMLVVRDLQVTFPGVGDSPLNVVKGVDLQVMDGEVVGIVGESGSGKTLTALALLGLVPAPAEVTARELTLAEADLVDLSEVEWKHIRGNRIAMVFQDPSTALNPVFTVGQQLIEAINAHDAGRTRRQSRDKAIELLELVGIPDPRDRIHDYPHQFSGGMAQRVMIAMALSCDPELLIADEPTTALDVTVQADILSLFRKLQRERGMSVIFVTHDLGVVSEVCDRVLVMYAGQLVESGPTEDVMTRPSHPYTEGLIRSMPQSVELHESLYRIPGQMPPISATLSGCQFAPRCEYSLPACTMDGAASSLLKGSPNREDRCLRSSELNLEGVE